jgi:hypothetical protein
MDRSEYWMLNVAVEYPQDLASLTLDNLEELMNREGHGLTCDQLVEVIDNLSRREYIGLFVAQPSKHESCVLDRKAIREELTRSASRKLHYQLAPKGIEQWELLSLPDWNLYIPAYCEMEGYIEAGSEQILQEVLQYDIAHPFRKVDLKSIENIEAVENWSATYWKTLPMGYRLCYSVEDIPYDSQEDCIKYNAFVALFHDWQKRKKWYKNPFD